MSIECLFMLIILLTQLYFIMPIRYLISGIRSWFSILLLLVENGKCAELR